MMNHNLALIWCLAYWVGLLLSKYFEQPLILSFLILSLVLIAGFQMLRNRFTVKDGLIAAAIVLFALVYLQLRFPRPHPQDISQLFSPKLTFQRAIVTGKVLSEVQQTNDNRQRFWLAAQTATIANQPQRVEGKVYVTTSNSREPIYPSQILTLEGVLYQPRSPQSPWEFDFKSYLARQGCFAGLKAETILARTPPTWGMWQIRERIVTAQRQGLGPENGSLLSSIILGRQAVSLPPSLKDAYTKVGLAHILAASGFHVALLLGVVLRLTRLSSPRTQFFCGIAILIFYLGLTGIQPAVFRAVLMGVGVLVGLLVRRRVKPLGSLLLAGTILLFINPLWLWDLGFQLSFLATLGLIVTCPLLDGSLDWLPSNFISLVSIPLAASLWTLPLLMHSFSSISTYGIPVNIITAPLVTLISLGGMLSGAMALINGNLGGILASLLSFPINALTAIVHFFIRLPVAYYTVGRLPLVVMIFIYVLIIFIHFTPWGRRQWKGLVIFMVVLLVVPALYSRLFLVQVTILPLPINPAIVIQQQGHTVLVNGDERDDFKYRILPFLSQQGINQLDGVVATNFTSISLPIKNHVALEGTPLGKSINIGKVTLEVLSQQVALVQFHLNRRTWLWLGKAQANIPEDLVREQLIEAPEVLLWSGGDLNPDWFNLIKPRMAIASSKFISPSLRRYMKRENIPWYWTKRDGALQWNEKTGLKATITEDIN